MLCCDPRNEIQGFGWAQGYRAQAVGLAPEQTGAAHDRFHKITIFRVQRQQAARVPVVGVQPF
jgi:hypothetical protein